MYAPVQKFFQGFVARAKLDTRRTMLTTKYFKLAVWAVYPDLTPLPIIIVDDRLQNYVCWDSA